MAVGRQRAPQWHHSPAFEKRIKRHIIGREQEFFIVTAPGLEQLCYDELLQLPLSSHKAAIVEGGIEFTGRLHDCYLANLHLRLANRIIMRVARFKSANFQRLGKKISAIAWELYLPRDQHAYGTRNIPAFTALP